MYFQNGYTSLHCASQEGHAETAKFLISAGASLEAVDGVYNTHVTIWCFFTVHRRGDVHLYFVQFCTDNQQLWLFSLSMAATFLQKRMCVSYCLPISA